MADKLQDMINKVCRDIPESWFIILTMENGSAWVEAQQIFTGYEIQPEFTDDALIDQMKNLLEQIKEQEEVGDPDE